MIKKKVRLEVICGESATRPIEIHNMNQSKPYRAYDVKCDRCSPLGSPFYLKGDETKREEVCTAYARWFNEQVLTFKNWDAYQELMRIRSIYRQQGQLRLFCWCAPKQCHVETIRAWLENNS